MYNYLQHLDSYLCTVTGSMDSNLCTVICSIWTVTYVQLSAASGQELMYNYLQHLDSYLCTVTGSMDSNLCTVTCSIWTEPSVDRLLYMFAITNKRADKILRKNRLRDEVFDRIFRQ
jgi:hypothetical protein